MRSKGAATGTGTHAAGGRHSAPADTDYVKFYYARLRHPAADGKPLAHRRLCGPQIPGCETARSARRNSPFQLAKQAFWQHKTGLKGAPQHDCKQTRTGL